MREIRFIDHSNPQLLKKALVLVRDVFWEFVASEYSDDGVIAFSEYIEYTHMVHLMQTGQLAMLGCFEDKRLAGVLALRVPDHISLLFVSKRYQNRGVATSLLHAAVRCIRKLCDADFLTVHATPSSAIVYQRMGFVPQAQQVVEHHTRHIPMKLAFAVSSANLDIEAMI